MTVDMRQDTKKLGKFLVKWNKEIQTESDTGRPGHMARSWSEGGATGNARDSAGEAVWFVMTNFPSPRQ